MNPMMNNQGHFEIEISIWISAILLIVCGFFSIQRHYHQMHLELEKDYDAKIAKLRNSN